MSQRPETGADAVTPQIERFRRLTDNGDVDLEPSPDGEWVRYVYAASLLKERERLQGAVKLAEELRVEEMQHAVAAIKRADAAEHRAEALATAIREISDTLLTDHQNRVENGLDGLPEAEQELVAVARRLRALVMEQD